MRAKVLMSFLLILAATVEFACDRARSTVATGQNVEPQPAEVVNGVYSVPTYPVLWPEMPAGPHKDVYESNCVTCHSQLYVLMQPDFSRATWTSEVEKMKKSYGAPIEDAKIPLIVDYLVAVRGAKPAGDKK